MAVWLFEDVPENRRMSPRRLLSVAGWLAGTTFVVGLVLGRGTWEHEGLAVGAFMLAIVTLFLAIGVESVRLALTRKLRFGTWAPWFLLLSPWVGLFPSYLCFSIPNERRVAATRRACEELILRLESHRRASGSYPVQPEPWMDLERRGIEYVSDGGREYRLRFQESLEDLSGLPNHDYESASATWSVSY